MLIAGDPGLVSRLEVDDGVVLNNAEDAEVVNPRAMAGVG